ncbi:unnamed protein product [Eruca vesicaria subsp. sativa]|uniref:Uncharacterized protein n=1 Tax=Eruca vesicaria subsp. sativa TaxID=29727 RepID=A0ABC8IXB1_ERUVS|nr:unnamed protein product [Eruca vesicaria subsp. sativa]
MTLNQEPLKPSSSEETSISSSLFIAFGIDHSGLVRTGLYRICQYERRFLEQQGSYQHAQTRRWWSDHTPYIFHETQGLKSGFGAYAASKSAVETMVNILAKELKGTGITANCVAPGPIATEMFFEGKISELMEKIAA